MAALKFSQFLFHICWTYKVVVWLHMYTILRFRCFLHIICGWKKSYVLSEIILSPQHTKTISRQTVSGMLWMLPSAGMAVWFRKLMQERRQRIVKTFCFCRRAYTTQKRIMWFKWYENIIEVRHACPKNSMWSVHMQAAVVYSMAWRWVGFVLIPEALLCAASWQMLYKYLVFS